MDAANQAAMPDPAVPVGDIRAGFSLGRFLE